MIIRHAVTVIALLAFLILAPLSQASDFTPAEARVIAKDANALGFPIVDNNRVWYACCPGKTWEPGEFELVK